MKNFTENLLNISISRKEIITVSLASAFVIFLFINKTLFGPFAIYDDSSLLAWSANPDKFSEFRDYVFNLGELQIGRFQPLFNITWLLRYLCFGTEPFYYYCFTAIEGIVSTVLFYSIWRYLGAGKVIAGLGSFFFLVHESFTVWCMALPPDADGLVLNLAGLLFIIRGIMLASNTRIGIGFSCLLASCFVKESFAALLPVWIAMTIIFSAWWEDLSFVDSFYRRKKLYLTIAFLYLLPVAGILSAMFIGQNGFYSGSSTYSWYIRIGGNLLKAGWNSLFWYPCFLAILLRWFSNKKISEQKYPLYLLLFCAIGIAIELIVYRDVTMHSRYWIPASLLYIFPLMGSFIFLKKQLGTLKTIALASPFVLPLAINMKGAHAGPEHRVASFTAFHRSIDSIFNKNPDCVGVLTSTGDTLLYYIGGNLAFYGVNPKLYNIELGSGKSNPFPENSWADSVVTDLKQKYETIRVESNFYSVESSCMVLIKDDVKLMEEFLALRPQYKCKEISETWKVFSFRERRIKSIDQTFFWICEPH